MHLNYPEMTLYSCIHAKIVFHETGPWSQKGWGPLISIIQTEYQSESTELEHLISSEPDIYSTFHSTAAKVLFFLGTHRTFPRIDGMLSHESLQKSKKIEIISSVFYNHNGMKLKINIKNI